MKLEFCFTAVNPAGRYIGMHTHAALEIVYYAGGEGETQVERKAFDFSRGLFTITPAGVHHDQANATEVTSLCFGISSSGLEELQGGWFDASGALGKACERLLAEKKDARPAHETVCRGLLFEIAGLARRACVEGKRKPAKKELVSRALEIIREEDGKTSVGDLSARLFVSKDYLRHLFREQTSQSPIRHIIGAKIERAKDLLARSDMPIKAIAAECGFENEYYFSRVFKHATAESPSAFRRASTEKDK